MRSLAIDKTNWSQRLDRPTYEAHGVMTGITFSSGGLKLTNDAEVEDTSGRPIPSLDAAREIIGGLYYHNDASGKEPDVRRRLRPQRRQGCRGADEGLVASNSGLVTWHRARRCQPLRYDHAAWQLERPAIEIRGFEAAALCDQDQSQHE